MEIYGVLKKEYSGEKNMIMPYLQFNGNCEEAFNFYANAFGGKIISISRLNGDPNNPVMHASIALTESGGSISGADTDKPVIISGMSILVLFPSRDKIEEIAPKLAEGGTLVSGFTPHPPPDDKGGGAEILDKYGYTWFLCC
ncbi:MAG: VOC family protein [Treponema sp.]|nr:VOC family protein [Treponema sp.]